jgi:glycyl-tRNA synthetase beta chain
MATFLLEIGTEELPADFAADALTQLQERVAKDLEAAFLQPSAIRVDGTPRRLVLRLHDLPARQPDRSEERKGPPARQAFVEGRPTGAAEGFARRCGVDPASLEVRDTDKGPFVFATIQQPGRPAAAVLAELAPAWILGLQGRRFMRWGSGESRFSRPVRWLVALLDAEIVPIALPDCDPPVASGRLSRGHRLRPDPLPIASAEAYGAALAGAAVQVERQERAATIRAAIEAAAVAADAAPDLPDRLFAELVDLVESPQLLEGGIEERFLALPPELLCTVMRVHQRYVPLLRLDAPPIPWLSTPTASCCRGSWWWPMATPTLPPRFAAAMSGCFGPAWPMPRSFSRPIGPWPALIAATSSIGSPSPRGSAACVTGWSGWSGAPMPCWNGCPCRSRMPAMPAGPPTSASTIW